MVSRGFETRARDVILASLDVRTFARRVIRELTWVSITLIPTTAFIIYLISELFMILRGGGVIVLCSN